MEKKIKIKSTSLTPLNETLQKLKLNDTISDFTPVIVEADGKFTSIMKTKEEFNPNDLGASFETEEQSEETKETKEQLLNKAKDALKQTLDNSEELNTILKKIKDLAKEDGYNTWELNKEKNTATLKSKNARIFKQNNNLCLSHNGKIELFHSVPELHNWLRDNSYPLPGNDIVIHESVEVKEANEQKKTSNRNWYDLLNKSHSKAWEQAWINTELANKEPNNTNNSLEFAGLGKAIPKEILQADKNKKAIINPNRSLLQKDTEVDECFGGVSASTLGSAVAYTATPKKKEEKEETSLQEAIDSFIPNDMTKFPAKREAVNKFLTWFKRNKPAIESGKIKLDKDFESIFDNIIEPTFLNDASDSMSKLWLKIITSRLKPLAARLSVKNNIPEDILLQNLLVKPNAKICALLSEELNSYIPDKEKYAFGKVELVPGQPLLDTSKKNVNPNYVQRLNWQKAGFQAKLGGASEKTEAIIKAFNDLKTFVKNKPYFTDDEVDLIKKYNLQVQQESITESAKKHPWLNKILGQSLTEEDSPADFAQGSPLAGNDTATTNTTQTTTTTDTPDATPDIDFGGDTGTGNPEFGDINIDAGGYSPDESEEEIPVAPNMPEYKIIDVLLNDDDNDIKVKVQNQDTKETEIKDLEDIDV